MSGPRTAEMPAPTPQCYRRCKRAPPLPQFFFLQGFPPSGKGYAGEGSHPTQRKRDVGWGCGGERRTMFEYGVGVGVGFGVGVLGDVEMDGTKIG